MFVAKLKESLLMKKLIESIKDIVTEINLEVTPLGMNIQAMDGSHVALVTVHLSCEGFEEYRCDKSVTLGISIGQLWKLMKCGGNDDSLTLKCNSEPSYLSISFENKKIKKSCNFNLALINIESENLGIPDTSYSSIITMSSTEFNRVTRELFNVAETVFIETNKDFVNFSINNEQVSGNIKIDANNSTNLEEATIIKVITPVNLSFALRYLNMFTKATPLSETVSLHLSSEYPLKVEYNMEGLGSLKYYLAPRITDEK